MGGVFVLNKATAELQANFHGGEAELFVPTVNEMTSIELL